MEVEEFIKHYGTRGMHWGVRNDKGPAATKALNIKQKTQVKVAAGVAGLASAGMATGAAASLYALKTRFEKNPGVERTQSLLEKNEYAHDAVNEGFRQARNSVIKGLVVSAVQTAAIAAAIGSVVRRTGKAYFTPLNKVYKDTRPLINKELKTLSSDIKQGKRPTLTSKQYESEVASIVSKRMATGVDKAISPFHALAQKQLGIKGKPDNLTITFEKLSNTELVSKMTISTPTGLKLVTPIKNLNHADSINEFAPNLEFYFDYKFDSDGHVVEWSCPTLEITSELIEGRFDMEEITKRFDPEANLQHSNSVNEFIAHYGVRGMHWGVRRSVGSGGHVVGPSKSQVSGSAKMGAKPAWQSTPNKKASLPVVSLKKGSLNKGKNQKTISEDTQQFRDIRAKVKREGVNSLSNKELEVINKRVDLQQKYNKAFPKKKSPFGLAADLVIDAVLTEAGERHLGEFIGPRSPDTMVMVRNALLLGRTTKTITKK